MSRFVFFALALALTFVLVGCLHTKSRTEDLRLVHEAYRGDFAQVALSIPPKKDGVFQVNTDTLPSFEQTLQAIREFRVKYKPQENELRKELAHLDVLEGMIYLQSRHFGSAAAIKTRVAEASRHLTSDAETVVRDRLFAKAFPHLIDGWEQINREFDEKAETEVDAEDLERAAEGIATVLEETISDDNDAPEVDSGGLYLATTAAIYWLWIHEIYAEACLVASVPCVPADTSEAAKNKAKEVSANVRSLGFYKKACGLIGRHLSSSEKEAAQGNLAEFGAGTSGRFRFLRWYAWFHELEAC